MKLRKQNRIRSRTIKKKSKFWCFGCDRNLVSTLKSKCTYCGFLNNNKKKIYK